MAFLPPAAQGDLSGRLARDRLASLGTGSAAQPLEYFGDRPEWFGFESYQKNLGKLLLEETGRLPVTVVEERSGTAATAAAVREVLAA